MVSGFSPGVEMVNDPSYQRGEGGRGYAGCPSPPGRVKGGRLQQFSW